LVEKEEGFGEVEFRDKDLGVNGLGLDLEYEGGATWDFGDGDLDDDEFWECEATTWPAVVGWEYEVEGWTSCDCFVATGRLVGDFCELGLDDFIEVKFWAKDVALTEGDGLDDLTVVEGCFGSWSREDE
jgi:hypothetical protein